MFRSLSLRMDNGDQQMATATMTAPMRTSPMFKHHKQSCDKGNTGVSGVLNTTNALFDYLQDPSAATALVG